MSFGPRSSCQVLVEDEARLYGVAQGYGQGPAAEAAAAAVLRACARARLVEGGRRSVGLAQIFEHAALELYQLRSVQHAYAGMSSSLALLRFDEVEVELGLAGDCVALLEREHSWVPLAHGGTQWLGPEACVQAQLLRLPRVAPLMRLLLVTSGALKVLATAGLAPERLTAARLRELCAEIAPLRDAGALLLELR